MPAFRECGARALAAACAYAAARHGRGVSVLRVAATEHFVSMAVGVHRGMRHADASLDRVRRCRYAPRTDTYDWLGEEAPSEEYAEVAGGDQSEMLGPLWSGPIFDAEWVRAECAALEEAAPDGPAIGILRKVAMEASCDEGDACFYHEVHSASRRVGVTDAPRLARVLERINERARGRGGGEGGRARAAAAATHFEAGRIRSAGGARAIEDAIRSLAEERSSLAEERPSIML